MILNTIGAAVGSVLLFDVPEGAAFFVEMVVVARGTNGAAALFRKSALIKRLVAQAPALVGMVATPAPITEAGSAAWTANPRITGNQVFLDCTGAAGVDVTWAILTEAHQA